MKSREDKLNTSSSEFGGFLGVSQQTASRYLSELEREGFIEKSRSGRGQLIRFTDAGMNLLEGIYLNLQNLFEEDRKLLIEGRVISGLGEGAYYVGKYADKLQEITGFPPFFGTLNIKSIRAYPNLEKYATGTLKGFRKDDRTFGGIKYLPVRLMGDGWEEECYIIIPQRTHHTDEIEIVSWENLREKYNLKDGNILRVEIMGL